MENLQGKMKRKEFLKKELKESLKQLQPYDFIKFAGQCKCQNLLYDVVGVYNGLVALKMKINEEWKQDLLSKKILKRFSDEVYIIENLKLFAKELENRYLNNMEIEVFDIEPDSQGLITNLYKKPYTLAYEKVLNSRIEQIINTLRKMENEICKEVQFELMLHLNTLGYIVSKDVKVSGERIDILAYNRYETLAIMLVYNDNIDTLLNYLNRIYVIGIVKEDNVLGSIIYKKNEFHIIKEAKFTNQPPECYEYIKNVVNTKNCKDVLYRFKR